MKKKLFTLLCAILCTTIAFAYDVCIDGIYYNLEPGTDFYNEAIVTYDGNYSDANGAGYTQTDIVIPSKIYYEGKNYGVVKIDHYAFYRCSSLTSVTIPSSVTEIGYRAFYGCNFLTSVTIPNSVTTIGSQVFAYCSFLSNIKVEATTPPTGVPSSPNLSVIFVPKGTKSAYESAWGGNYLYIDQEVELTVHVSTPGGLEDAIFNQGKRPLYVTKLTVTGELNDDDFTLMRETMTSLYSINLAGISNTSLGSGFSGKNVLLEIVLPENLTTLDNYAFQKTKISSISIPNSVTSIGSDVFYDCDVLKSVYISDLASWCNIDFSAYYSNPLSNGADLYINNKKITDFVIPNDVTTIGDHAFSGCSSLTSVTIPNSVTSIGGSAFSGCSSLTSVTIPNSVTTIGGYAFSDCSFLTSVTIPNSVTSIGGGAFSGCSSLTSVTIPNSVITIEERAFDGCSSLTSVTMSNSVTSIGGYAFFGCSSLTSVTIPNSVTSIGKKAFPSNLKSLTLTNENLSIETSTFSGISLDTIYCLILTPPDFTESHFSGVDEEICVLIVPEGSIMDYYKHSYWGTFYNIMNIKLEDVFIYLSSDNKNMGDVIGGGNYEVGSEAIIEAIPNRSYNFTHWSDDNTDNPRVINVDRYMNLTAYFTEATPLVVNASSMNSAMGNVYVSNYSGWGYYKGDTIELTAGPITGYSFSHWNDQNTENPRTVILESDTAFYAYFTKDAVKYTITATTYSGQEEYGYVTGGGEYTEGDIVTLTAVANDGYEFDYWGGGSTSNPRVFTATENVEYYAYFKPKQYELAVYLNNTSYGYLWYETMHSNSSCKSYVETLSYGTKVTFTVGAYEGYQFTGWSDGNTDNPREFIITDNFEITANIVEKEKPNYTISTLSNNDDYGYVEGAGSYVENTNVTITAVAYEGYEFVEWNDGNTDNPRYVTATEDITYTATFAEATYTIQVISNDGSNAIVTGGGNYKSGETVQLTATAKPGYEFSYWRDDNWDYYYDNPLEIVVDRDNQYYAYFNYVTVEVDGIYYRLENYNMTAQVVNPDNGTYYGDIVIPETITVDDYLYTVTQLAYEAFYNSEVTSVVIPASIESIGSYSFTYCNYLSFVEFLGTTPPSSDSYAFMWGKEGIQIKVPCETTALYEEALGVSDYWYFTESDYVMNLLVKGDYYSSKVEIIDALGCDDNTATIYANPWYADVRFVQWSDGNTDNPRIVTINSDTTFTAEFENVIAISVMTSDSIQGSVTGGGQFLSGEEVVISANPNVGYVFDCWMQTNWDGNNEKYYYEPTLSFEAVGHCKYIAYFRIAPILIDGVYYFLNNEDMTASVARSENYSGEISVPKNVTYQENDYVVVSVEPRAFATTSITSLSIADGIDVDYSIIDDCNNLQKIKADDSVIMSVSESLYYIGESLREIHITSGYLDDMLYIENNHVELLNLAGLENEELYEFFFKEDLECLSCSWSRLKTLVLPNGLQKIYQRQFENLWSLREIVIPEQITEIPNGAFYNCHALSNIVFNKNLVKIGDYAFYNAHNIESLVITEGVTEIGDAAFYGSVYLEELELPYSMKVIGDNAFALCSKLNVIKSKSHTPPTIEAKTFYEVNREIPVYVPEVSLDKYLGDIYWKEFFNIIGTKEYNEEPIPTEVDQTENSSIVIYTQGGVIYIDGIQTAYDLFDAAGKLIYSGRDTQISVPSGVYILKVENEVHKIVL